MPHFVSKSLSSLSRLALDCVFPKYCLGCDKEGTHLCDECLSGLPISKGIACFACGRRSPQGYACKACRKNNYLKISGLLVVSEWENPLLKQLIYAYKYNFIKELAVPLSTLASEYLKTHFADRLLEEIIFIPVPLHPRRLAWRDFNQAELLAKTIGKILAIPIAEKILVRNRYTLPQAEIHNQTERKLNLKNAFSLRKDLTQKNKELLKNKIVILIDDVATTGATFQECAKALGPLSPREIWGLVIARG